MKPRDDVDMEEPDRAESVEQVTPEPSDTTETEDDAEVTPAISTVMSKGAQRSSNRQRDNRSKVKIEQAASQSASVSQRTTRGQKMSEKPDDAEAPPPRRDLPFAKAKAVAGRATGKAESPANATQSPGDDDTESDDEL